MRYIGNKTKLVSQIQAFIADNAGNDFSTFCDLFSGTGSVAAAYAPTKKVIASDILRSSFILTQGYAGTREKPTFASLGCDPFVYLNQPQHQINGFVYYHFAPTGADRMYFSDTNAARIDFIRTAIEDWHIRHKITDQEYYYLLACLLEAVSRVANVAGVYGAFLKSWDPRALKPIRMLPLSVDEYAAYDNEIYHADSLELLDKLQGDVLYLDPPYTHNDYAIQYHVLETISKYDAPKVNGITAARSDTKKSVFSSKASAYVAFEKVIAEAKFRFIVVSYSNKGLLEQEFIEKVLKKYAVPGSYSKKTISHRRYTNSRSAEDKSVHEYLFFIEKDGCRPLVESPLNYMGSKYGILHEIVDFAGDGFDKVVDVFGGGFNVGVNLRANQYVYNDLNHFVGGLVKMFQTMSTSMLVGEVLKRIEKYGLQKSHKKAFVALRDRYNTQEAGKKDMVDLYILLLYGFQQQFRFNSKHEFNNTVGMSNFNSNTLLKILQFSRELKTKSVQFHAVDFELLKIKPSPKTLFYCDPPYLVTLGSYNDGKRGFLGWTEKDEVRLYAWLDKIHADGGRFVVSNILRHKDRVNTILWNWLARSGYQWIEVKHRTRTELLIKNY